MARLSVGDRRRRQRRQSRAGGGRGEVGDSGRGRKNDPDGLCSWRIARGSIIAGAHARAQATTAGLRPCGYSLGRSAQEAPE